LQESGQCLEYCYLLLLLLLLLLLVVVLRDYLLQYSSFQLSC
jgi:hypothetical protein